LSVTTQRPARPRPADPTRETPQRFGDVESQALERHAARRRELDRELAGELRQRSPGLAPITAMYLRDLDRRPTLSEARQGDLLAAAIAGDGAARGELIEAFLPLIAQVARTYRHSSAVDRADLLQEGVVGLLRALERFDPDLGVPFWAYASVWVRQAMQQLVAELTRPLVLSDRALRQLAHARDVHREHMQRRRCEPSPAELAREAGISEEQLANLIASDPSPRATEEPLAGADAAVGMFGDLLEDPLPEREYERALGDVEVAQLRSLLSSLSERERAVLRARYGLAGAERTQREIADRLGLSAVRVRQIEQRALGKLRAAASFD
jgi:RNA polymerase sigma factor (sigma-70 family)